MESHLSYTGPLPVRGGSYGDPAAVPFEVWEALLSQKKHWTMYTHMWRTCDQRLKKFSMASVDTPEERDEAQAMGWRTFMVVPEEEGDLGYIGSNAGILCPATVGKTTCSTCLMCKGTSSNMAKSIWEPIHGKNKGNHQWIHGDPPKRN